MWPEELGGQLVCKEVNLNFPSLYQNSFNTVNTCLINIQERGNSEHP